jgi:hypothetical protein
MKGAVRICSLLLMACALLAEGALARSYLNCLTRRIVIVDASSGSSSKRIALPARRTIATNPPIIDPYGGSGKC